MMIPKYAVSSHAAALLCVVALVGPLCAHAAPQGGPVAGEVPYAQAVEAFRAGRFPEAYGRFVALAEAGHANASRHALWMCEHGPSLFGRHWDCGPEQVERWTVAARRASQAQAISERPGVPAAQLPVSKVTKAPPWV